MNIQKMMKQVQDMQNKLAGLQDKMADMEIEGKSGGGMVKVVLTGKGEVKKIMIDDKNFSDTASFSEDLRVVEDLLIAAFNDAKSKVEDEYNNQVSSLTGGLALPPGIKLPF